MDTPLLNATEIRQRIWQELQRAVQDRHHEWRTPVLASVGADALPQARTVVLRHADAQQAVLQLYTDSRSPKVAELETMSCVALVFWSKRLAWQLRVRAEATVQRSGSAVDAVWTQVSATHAAGDYLSPKVPGEVWSDEAANSPPEPMQHHLAIVTLKVQAIDWLELDRTRHRRAVFTPDQWEWRVP